MLRPTQVRFGKGWILTGWFRVCWKRDGEKNEDRKNCISGVGERQKREYQKHVRRVCSVGKTEKEGGVVKGKEMEEVESEEEGGKNRALYESICYNAGPNWRNEYVANLSLTTQVNVNNGNKRLNRRM